MNVEPEVRSGITSYSSERSWEARVAQSVPGFTRQPASCSFNPQ